RRETIGLFEAAWNDFDRLNANTRLLHNTRRRTQPWKTGLPVDYMLADKVKVFPPFALINRARRQMFGDYGLLGRYRRHPGRKPVLRRSGMRRAGRGSAMVGVPRGRCGSSRIVVGPSPKSKM